MISLEKSVSTWQFPVNKVIKFGPCWEAPYLWLVTYWQWHYRISWENGGRITKTPALIAGAPFPFPSFVLFSLPFLRLPRKLLHCLPVDQRIEFKVLLFTYKPKQGLFPQYLSDLREPYSPLRSLRSASNLLLNSPSFNLRTYAYKSFSVCAPRLWNSLPVYIKSSSSVDIFGKRLKTYLFALFSIILRFLICLDQLQNTLRWRIEQ